METETDEAHTGGGWLTTFLDRIWLQFAITTGITVFWLIWIVYEILIKGAPL